MLEEMWSREVQRQYMNSLKFLPPIQSPTKKPLWKRLKSRVGDYVYNKIRYPLACWLLGYEPNEDWY